MPATTTNRKAKPCKVCGAGFYPFKTTDKWCSIDCAVKYGLDQVQAKRKKETNRMRREFNEKDRSYQIKKAQAAFNAYIRTRDAGKPCISCKKNSGAKMNAGHYLSVGAHPELRFEPDNCHLQCEWCNSYLSGNIARYRINLIEKIGLEKVEWLEGPHEPKNYTLDDIKEITRKFKAKTKKLKNI